MTARFALMDSFQGNNSREQQGRENMERRTWEARSSLSRTARLAESSTRIRRTSLPTFRWSIKLLPCAAGHRRALEDGLQVGV